MLLWQVLRFSSHFMIKVVRISITVRGVNMRLQKGFSLIEIMVVVVILGILASIVVPKIISRPDEARVVKAKQDVLAIQSALDLYKLDNGFYPSSDQGLIALVEKPTSNPTPGDWKQYLKSLPKDPWGRDYLYLNPGEHLDVDIFTYGAKGEPGGSGIDAEVGNWDAR
jgi:general secretion pathway protein G